MSYIAALQRVDEIRARMNLGRSNAVTTFKGFDQVLATAQNRFNNGPTELTRQTTTQMRDLTRTTNEVAARLQIRSGSANADLRAPDFVTPTKVNGWSDELKAMFDEAANRFGVPREMLIAVSRAESAFRSEITSPAGAQGLMQLMPATARGLGVTEISDPWQNIAGGAKYLRQMLDRFKGDVDKSLAAYNAGPGAVEKHGGVPPFNETQTYVARVRKYAGELGWSG